MSGHSQDSVKIVVVGDHGVGKTSLITTVVSTDFQEKVPPKIPPVLLPKKKERESVRTEIIDTSSKPADQHKVEEDIKRADFVCIVYDVNNEKTKESIESIWIPRIRKLNENRTVPIGLCGNKTDIRDAELGHKRGIEEFEQEMMPIRNKFEEIEYMLECSAREMDSAEKIDEFFWFAQDSVLYPRMPLCTVDLTFTDEFVSVLKRIFQLLDLDKDGVLSDEEIRNMEQTCFSESLDDKFISTIKNVISTTDPKGLNAKGITERGFVTLFHILLERSRKANIWKMLRNFGYDNNLKLRENFCVPDVPIKKGEQVELSTVGVKFLTYIFMQYNERNAGILTKKNLQKLFLVVPDRQYHPWRTYGFPECCPTHRDPEIEFDNDLDDAMSVSSNNTMTSYSSRGSSSYLDDEQYEAITLKTWLAMWTMTTFYDHKETLRYLAYLGFGIIPPVRKDSGTDNRGSENQQSVKEAITITNRKLSRLNPRNTRSVYLCYVFGSNGSGKHTILRAFINKDGMEDRPFSTAQMHSRTSSRTSPYGSSSFIRSNFAVNDVHDKYLILEIPSEGNEGQNADGSLLLPSIFTDQIKMRKADCIMLVYDQSSISSFKYAENLYRNLNRKYRDIPTFFVATKCDLPSFTTFKQPGVMDPAVFFNRNKLPPPISVQDKQMGNLFQVTMETALENKVPRSKRVSDWGIMTFLIISSAGVAALFVLSALSSHYKTHNSLQGLTLSHFMDYGNSVLGWFVNSKRLDSEKRS